MMTQLEGQKVKYLGRVGTVLKVEWDEQDLRYVWVNFQGKIQMYDDFLFSYFTFL